MVARQTMTDFSRIHSLLVILGNHATESKEFFQFGFDENLRAICPQ